MVLYYFLSQSTDICSYDMASDVAEMLVRFASKILTPRRMH